MKVALENSRVSELAEATWSYARPDAPEELGAMKIFGIREDEQQSLARLKQEIQILRQNRPGLAKLLDSNESERWMVTEYFPEGTLEDNILRYEGKPALALKAFLSLVKTVSQLHSEDIVHRDTKPANVFVRSNDELVLGDFGIVFIPDQPARLTRTNESVGPHDYMPPWADVGTRLAKVEPNFDVYMLGKLLWSMVSGRPVLRREWFAQPENDVTRLFPHDPHSYMINDILEHCVVEKPDKCFTTAGDLLLQVLSFVETIKQRGQILWDNIPRPCHVCGNGHYAQQRPINGISTYQMGFGIHRVVGEQ
jgi:serine/threonine protein kinase